MDPITDLPSFVDRLIAEKGLEGLDPDVLREVRADLLSRLTDRVNAELLAHVPADKIQELDAVLAQEDAAKVQEFVSTQVPKASEIVARALLDFRTTYLNG